MRNKVAVAYARFSSDNQREESIEAQIRAISDYCSRNSIALVNRYCDRARSATTDDRPSFLQMIDDAKNQQFDYVIVHKLDRFSRNRYDSAHYKKELKRNGVSVLSVLENLDDSPESIILESVLEGMSEYYSKNLAREVMKGMRESALQCRPLGGQPPYGYIVNKEKRCYEIHEQQAQAVKLIYNRVIEGIGYHLIISELNALGHKTGAGKPFTKNSITEILRNEKYTGMYIFNRASSKDSDGKRNNHKSKSNEEMIRIPDGMPRIIDQETFEKVSSIIKGRSLCMKNKRAKETYLLTGKIFCGLCSKAFVGNRGTSGPSRSLLVTYRCSKKNDYGNEHCTNKLVNKKFLEAFIINEVGKIAFSPERIPDIIAGYAKCEVHTEYEAVLRLLKDNLKSIDAKITNITNVIAHSGSMSLLEKLDDLEAERVKLEVEIEAQRLKCKKNVLDEKEIVAAYEKAKKLHYSGDLEETKQLINLYVSRVDVYEECVEIIFANVPGNLLQPTDEKGLLSGNVQKKAKESQKQAKEQKKNSCKMGTLNTSLKLEFL